MGGRFVWWIFLLWSLRAFLHVRAAKIYKLTTAENTARLSECGTVPTSPDPVFKIYGGGIAAEGTLPWAVKIIRKDRYEEQFRECTGTLISKRHVITAGNCIEYKDIGGNWITPVVPDLDDYFVLGGSSCVKGIVDRLKGKLQDCVGLKGNPIVHAQGVQLKVKSLLVPSKSIDQRQKYKAAGKPVFTIPFSDIAILELESDITQSANIKPVCLARGETSATRVVVHGFGSTESYGPFNSLLHYAELDVMAKTKCEQNERLRGTDCSRLLVTSRKLTDNTADFNATCRGDEGAGMIVGSAQGNRGELVAVMSYGLDACDPSNLEANAYSEASTKINVYRDFICYHTGVCDDDFIGTTQYENNAEEAHYFDKSYKAFVPMTKTDERPPDPDPLAYDHVNEGTRSTLVPRTRRSTMHGIPGGSAGGGPSGGGGAPRIPGLGPSGPDGPLTVPPSFHEEKQSPPPRPEPTDDPSSAATRALMFYGSTVVAARLLGVLLTLLLQ